MLFLLIPVRCALVIVNSSAIQYLELITLLHLLISMLWRLKENWKIIKNCCQAKICLSEHNSARVATCEIALVEERYIFLFVLFIFHVGFDRILSFLPLSVECFPPYGSVPCMETVEGEAKMDKQTSNEVMNVQKSVLWPRYRCSVSKHLTFINKRLWLDRFCFY